MEKEHVVDVNGSQIYDLGKIASENGYKSYLEVGVLHGTTFLSIPCDRRVAVDPAITTQFIWNKFMYTEMYKIVNNDKEPDMKIYAMPSDEFFKINTEKFDMVFIDGLHRQEQVMCDILNSITFLNPGGTIACHDTNPISKDSASLEMNDRAFWCGDVFKAIIDLRVNRADLDIYTIDVPCGLTIIKKNTVSAPVLDHKYMSYEYEDFDKERDLILNLRK